MADGRLDVSIIIPFRNAAGTLERAFVSVVKALKAAPELVGEIILIDDGSEDGGKELAEGLRAGAAPDGAPRDKDGSDQEFCTQLKDVRILEGGGRGVSAARNLGLSEASGSWITFADADDELAESFFTDILIPVMNDETVDVVCSGYEFLEDAGDKGKADCASQGAGAAGAGERAKPAGGFRRMSGYSYLENRLLGGDMHMWAKAYRREALDGLEFIEGLTIGEDLLYLADLALKLGKKRSVMATDVPGYRYFVNPAGAMERPYNRAYLDEIRCWTMLAEKLEPEACALSPYVYTSVASDRIRTALNLAHKVSRLDEEKWDSDEAAEGLEAVRRAVIEAKRTRGAVAGLGMKDRIKMLIFLADRKWFLRLASLKF